MSDYFLSNYDLSFREALSSFFISEYGKRHMEEAARDPEHRVGHYIIGAIELFPVLGLLVSVIERAVYGIFCALGYVKQVDFIQLWRGCQADAGGIVAYNQVKRVCHILNGSRAIGVKFDPGLIPENLTGGTCSAMSFDYIDNYLKQNEGIGDDTTRRLEVIKNMRLRYAVSSTEFRINQTAFNTICKFSQEHSEDFKKDKMASMLNFYDRKIVHASREVSLLSRNAQKKICSILDNLSYGVFAVRALLTADNAKEEERGHTMVLIKEKDGCFFYDANVGVLQLVKGSEAKVLHNCLQAACCTFNIPNARFYQVV